MYAPLSIVHKLGLVLAYLGFLSVSVVPVVYAVYPPSFTGTTVRPQAQALLARLDRLHLAMLGPGTTALRTLTSGAQMERVAAYGAFTALGDGAVLGGQALVFAGVAAAGVVCLYMAPRAWKGYRPVTWNAVNWYRCVGWAVVDGLVVAAIQGRLWVALRPRAVAQRLTLGEDVDAEEWEDWL